MLENLLYICKMNTNNGLSAGKLLNDINLISHEETSTTSKSYNNISIPSSEGKREVLQNCSKDMVCSLNENLERFYNKKYHYIYKTTNIDSRIYYIGRHSTNNLEDNYKGSGTVLKRMFKKYGKKSFKTEVLLFCKNFQELLNKEEEIVNEDLLKDPLCINLIVGGLNPSLKGEQNPNYGKSLSKEQRLNLSRLAIIRYKDNDNPFKGKKHTMQTKEKLSLLAKERFKYSNNPFKNKEHSIKTKQIISQKLKIKMNDLSIKNKIKEKRSLGYYYTPKGIFITSRDAAKANNCSKSTIILRCIKKVDKPIGYNYQIPIEYRGNKTWREMGWHFVKSNSN